MIEVTMIRTEESVQKSFGVNLMDGLNLGRSFTQAADGSITKTSQLYNTMASATTAAPVGATVSVTQGFLNYSMNIANSLYTKNEVIARPTLAAVDRLPSVFLVGEIYLSKLQVPWREQPAQSLINPSAWFYPSHQPFGR